MLGETLLTLASLVGVRQADVARRLGIEPAAVSYWATGRREVPEKYREGLLALVFESANAHAWEVRTLPPILRRQRYGPTFSRQTFFRKLLALTLLCRVESFLARGGFEPQTALTDLRDALLPFTEMPDDDMRKLETAQRLNELARDFAALMTKLDYLGPLMDLANSAEEHGDARNDDPLESHAVERALSGLE